MRHLTDIGDPVRACVCFNGIYLVSDTATLLALFEASLLQISEDCCSTTALQAQQRCSNLHLRSCDSRILLGAENSGSL